MTGDGSSFCLGMFVVSKKETVNRVPRESAKGRLEQIRRRAHVLERPRSNRCAAGAEVGRQLKHFGRRGLWTYPVVVVVVVVECFL